MGMMRKLLMGGTPGERTLVSTTDPHTSLQRMDTPITMKVGASYSISWTGAMPTTSGYIYPFKVYGGYGVISDMCNVSLNKGKSDTHILATLFSTTVANIGMVLSGTVTLELRFTIMSATETDDGFTVYSVYAELYVNGNRVGNNNDIKKTRDIGDGLTYYENIAGTFVIKKLS